MINQNIQIECSDKNCPFHGNLSVRGRIFEGNVISDSPKKTVSVEYIKIKKAGKYNRYMKKKKIFHAHNPPCIEAQVGDRVKIAECRKLSKTKSFVIIEKGG